MHTSPRLPAFLRTAPHSTSSAEHGQMAAEETSPVAHVTMVSSATLSMEPANASTGKHAPLSMCIAAHGMMAAAPRSAVEHARLADLIATPQEAPAIAGQRTAHSWACIAAVALMVVTHTSTAVPVPTQMPPLVMNWDTATASQQRAALR